MTSIPSVRFTPPPREVKFALDSSVEEAGFEVSVPLR